MPKSRVAVAIPNALNTRLIVGNVMTLFPTIGVSTACSSTEDNGSPFMQLVVEGGH